MDGTDHNICIEDIATGATLKTEVEMVTGIAARDQKLIFQGMFVANSQKLHEMGIFNESVIHLVIEPSPPTTIDVHLADPDFDYSDVCHQSVTGTYTLMNDSRIDGRPMYSKNTGSSKKLYYQSGRGRWVVADAHDWNSYADNSWAYCVSDASHPGQLDGCRWNVTDRSFRNYPAVPIGVSSSFEDVYPAVPIGVSSSEL